MQKPHEWHAAKQRGQGEKTTKQIREIKLMNDWARKRRARKNK